MKEVQSGVDMHGWSFHWTQAVWREVAGLGLQPDYNKKETVYQYVKKMMALPFLPAEHIGQAHRKLTLQAGTPALEHLCTYVRDTWIESTVWTP